MATYKLHYFNVKALGELPRLLFATAGVQYEDVRYGNAQINVQGQDFGALKNSGQLPFGQVPLLEVTENGHTYRFAQSGTITRFLARTFGLYGDPHCGISGALVDQVYEGVRDVQTAYLKTRNGTDQEKEAAKVDFFANVVPKFLGFFNNLLADGHHYFVGNRISLADIALFNLLDNLDKTEVQKNCEKFPKLHENHERVRRHLHSYLESRPHSPF